MNKIFLSMWCDTVTESLEALMMQIRDHQTINHIPHGSENIVSYQILSEKNMGKEIYMVTALVNPGPKEMG